MSFLDLQIIAFCFYVDLYTDSHFFCNWGGCFEDVVNGTSWF